MSIDIPRLALRTVLFSPGDRPDRIAKAMISGAETVAIDLEDAVALSCKEEARAGLTEVLSKALPVQAPGVAVRVNSVESGLFEADLTAVESVLLVVDLVILPMVTSVVDVYRLAGALDLAEARSGKPQGSTAILPLVETARGVFASPSLASCSKRVVTLTFGPADLSNELGITPTADGSELLYARSRVVLAAAAAGCRRPIDGPFLDLNDNEGLLRSAQTSRSLGYGGKQVIHPKQIETVHNVFSFNDGELEWARHVVEAFDRAEDKGVSSIRLKDGTFVDYPIASRARRMLAEHEKFG